MNDDWTVDASGHYVDWTMPPYREPGSGVLHLVLEGEESHNISAETHQKRICEYMLLVRRQMRRA